MGRGVSSRVIWAGSVVLASSIAVGTLIALLVYPVPWHDDAVFVFSGLAPAAVGAVLVLRKPDNLIAKLLIVIGSIWLLGEASRIYLWMSLHVDLPATHLAAWLLSWAFVPAWALIPVLLAVFPSGRVVSGWLRIMVRVYLWFLALLMLASMFTPQDLGESYGDSLAGFDNPFALEVLTSIEGSTAATVAGAVFDVGSGISVLVLALGAILDLMLRWKRSTGAERLQMRAFALGALVMTLLLIVSSVVVAVGNSQLLENLCTTLAIATPSVAIGVAILRYRLYQIDRLISRTVTYALVAGLLVAIFAAIAVGLPQALGLGEESPFAVAGATLIVAASFNPLRRRIKSSVDHRFDRSRYDAQREVDRFTDRLRDLVDVDDLKAEVLSVVSGTMRPAGVSIWLAAEQTESHVDG